MPPRVQLAMVAKVSLSMAVGPPGTAGTGRVVAPWLLHLQRRGGLCTSVGRLCVGGGRLCRSPLSLSPKIGRHRRQYLCSRLLLQLEACTGAARGVRWCKYAGFVRQRDTSWVDGRLSARGAPVQQDGSRGRGSAVAARVSGCGLARGWCGLGRCMSTATHVALHLIRRRAAGLSFCSVARLIFRPVRRFSYLNPLFTPSGAVFGGRRRFWDLRLHVRPRRT